MKLLIVQPEMEGGLAIATVRDKINDYLREIGAKGADQIEASLDAAATDAAMKLGYILKFVGEDYYFFHPNSVLTDDAIKRLSGT